MLTVHSLLRGLLLVLLGALGALTPVMFQSGQLHPFDSAQALSTFTQGYAAMEERTLKDITAGELALEGLHGLAALSPELVLQQAGDRLLLFDSERLVSSYPLPKDVDVRGWARLTVTVITEARTLSDDVADADLEEIYQAIFDAALARLDVFSRYAGAEEARRNREDRNGFGGIGLRFELSAQGVLVVDLLPDTPAAQAGLQVGDEITHVDGHAVAGEKRDTISRMLRGPVGTVVRLDWQHDGRPVTASLPRQKIVEHSVSGHLDDGVGVIRLSTFNDDTSFALEKMILALRREAGSHWYGVVLDLRGNPGGLLDQAIAVADLFLASGVIVHTEGRHPRSSQTYTAQDGDSAETVPLVVLMDGMSASASEIVAAALQDNQRALVVGSNSYGKGTVQTVIALPNGGEITLTWSRFMSPSGYALQDLGVQPNICTAHLLSTGRLGQTVDSDIWRAAAADPALRSQVRTFCPAEHAPVQGDDFDLRLAEQILRTAPDSHPQP